MNCDDHLPDICRKAGGKLNALARIAPSIGLFKRYLQLNDFFNSQFSYCPLILDVPPVTQIIGKLRSCMRYVYILFTITNSYYFQNC